MSLKLTDETYKQLLRNSAERHAIIDERDKNLPRFDKTIQDIEQQLRLAKHAKTQYPQQITQLEANLAAAKSARKDFLDKWQAAYDSFNSPDGEYHKTRMQALKEQLTGLKQDAIDVTKNVADITNTEMGNRSNLSPSFYRDIAASFTGRQPGNTMSDASTTAKAQTRNQQNEAANRQMEAQKSQQIADRNEYTEAGKVASMQNDAQNRQNIANKEGIAGSAAALMRQTNTPDINAERQRQDQQRNIANNRRQEADIAQQGATQSMGNALQFAHKADEYDSDYDNNIRLNNAITDSVQGTGNNPEGTNPNGTNPSGNNPEGTNPSGTNPEDNNPSGTNPSGTNPEATPPEDMEKRPESTPPDTTEARKKAEEEARINHQNPNESTESTEGTGETYTPSENLKPITEQDIKNKLLEIKANLTSKYQYDDTVNVQEQVANEFENWLAQQKLDPPLNHNDYSSSSKWFYDTYIDSDERLKCIQRELSDYRMKWIRHDLEEYGAPSESDFAWLMKQVNKDYTPGINDDTVLKGYADNIRNYVYNYKPEAQAINPNNDPSVTHIGPMAQDIEKVNPACISKDENGIESVDPGRVALMNAGAIGDIARTLEDIQNRLMKLEARNG